MKLVPLPGGKYALVLSNGYTEHLLAVLDSVTEKIVQRVPIAEGWLGLAVSPARRTVYASGGSRDKILVYRFADGVLTANEEKQPRIFTDATDGQSGHEASRTHRRANIHRFHR